MSTKTRVMFGILSSFALLATIAFTVAPAQACHVDGRVFCDANGDGVVSPGDLPLGNVTVDLLGLDCAFSAAMLTQDEYDVGYFYADVQQCQYSETLRAGTIPYTTWSIVSPAGGVATFAITEFDPVNTTEWLIDSPECRPTPESMCWLTAGGVKFSSAIGAYLDEFKPRSSVLHSWGGNVNPACAPVKGHWNHIAHKSNLHFQATDIEVIRCGNVEGIPPGSESPVTPVNFIEFTGPATLKGVNGNKADYGAVCYFARAEDRNEPGSNGARDGSFIDRYFLHVYNCATLQTLLLVDIDANAGTIDPLTITGGNMQMHYQPCGN